MMQLFAEPADEADRGRHPGFPRFKVLAGGPGNLAERSADAELVMTETTVNTQVVHKWYARPVFFVTDLEASLRFYTDKLGFTKKWHKATVCQVEHGECEIILCQSDK